jgi:preprotein translocase subunit SecE
MDDTKTIAEDKGPRFNPVEFARETRREIAKVTWPTRKETLVTTAMIVVMAALTGLFFLGIDSVLGFTVSRLLGMKG